MMQEDFYIALSELYSPAEIIEKMDISFDTLRYYFDDYIDENARVFEDDLPEYFEVIG